MSDHDILFEEGACIQRRERFVGDQRVMSAAMLQCGIVSLTTAA
jgi:hypothetical protein